jgi:hypothetical protein
VRAPAAAGALSEAQLAYLWEGQRFPRGALRTREGLPLRVIYRGRAPGGPGPDYRGAIISTPQGLLQGDVELHVRSSDFRRHGHHLDPAYDNLALHLVFQDDEGGPTRLACGRAVPVVALDGWLAERTRQIYRWLARPPGWEEPCRSAAGRLGAPAAGAALDRLGDMRFRQKSALFARALRETDPEQALWEALLEALGYGGARSELRAAARRAPWAELRPLLAALPARQRAAAAAARLFASFAEAPGPEQHTPIRPRNRPAARLRAAAALAARFAPRGLWPPVAQALALPPTEAARRLTGLYTVSGAVGRARAIEIAANAALPCAAALGHGPAAEAAYAALPLPARYGGVKHIHAALAGAVPLTARRQQGMLYLLKQYCTQGGCGRCVLS